MAQRILEKEAPSLRVIDSDATYFLWADVSAYGKSSDEFCAELRARTGLYISSGASYGKAGEGFVRINLATQRERVCDGMKRLINYLNSL